MIRKPTDAQRAAADPAHSAWVGANAGSGKTRVLTERVARLLLAGTGPGRILCLTYTKAAAAEMQTRLFDRLGRWAMADDAALADELAAISGIEARPDVARLDEARRLFAAALETPGGLKIQTIHAFCAALLVRFPLEAGLSPRADLMDDRTATLMLRRIASDMARAAETGADTAFDAAARRLNEADMDRLVGAVLAERGRLGAEDLEDALGRLFGAAADGPEAVAARALSRLDALELRLPAMAAALVASGGRDGTRGEDLTRALERSASPALGRAHALVAASLTSGKPYKAAAKKATVAENPWLEAAYERLADWAQETDRALGAAETAQRSRDLHRFAAALLARYEAAKRARGLLDYHDLIARSVALLTRSDMAAWALYKLDEGIEHVLVDEAQDTAPLQWRLIEALTAEFFAGEGRAETRRTLFAVGDEKQSIYRFQGAEPRAFGEMRERFAARISGAGQTLTEPALETSFRSAPGILGFVDAVFQGRTAALSASGAAIRHRASRASDGARVDLWPLAPRTERPEPPAWWAMETRPSPDAPKVRLAQSLAEEIARIIREDRRPPRDGTIGARVRPGDILVLVRTRAVLAPALIRRLKSLGVPVAGADRLRLGAELAVQDLLALLKVAVQPEDDLSLAAVLRSPLADLDEAALYDLAHGRGGTLADALRAATEQHGQAAELVADVLARADYLTPHALLERILIRHDGRRRLIARLGPEAEDLIDELLEQALVYETREPPTLAGFIDWVEAESVEVKREMAGGGPEEEGSGEVRVMTVHGAKGLEAPIVILPDTVGGGRRQGPRIVPADPEGPLLWLAPGARDPVTAAAEVAAREEDARETLRLLYVALTRAEDWLILCGAEAERRPADDWYAVLETTAQGLEGAALQTPFGSGVRIETGTATGTGVATPEDHDPQISAHPEPLPGWLAPVAIERRPRARSPSSLLPHAAVTVREAQAEAESDRTRDAALRHGEAVHLLLERLADVEAGARSDLAERLLTAEMPDLDATERDAALAEASGVFAAPFAAAVFGPGSVAEATLALRLEALSDTPMIGRIDRLAVTADRVLVVDFKTDTRVPTRPADVPPAYLAQLAAYCTALGESWPDRKIEAAIVWSAVPGLMVLPADLLAGALSGAARPPLDLAKPLS